MDCWGDWCEVELVKMRMPQNFDKKNSSSKREDRNKKLIPHMGQPQTAKTITHKKTRESSPTSKHWRIFAHFIL